MKKYNKRLLSAIATFGTSLALLIGGAFAWFSASANAVTSGQFIIGSLDLDAKLSEYIPPSDDPESTVTEGSWKDAASIDIDGMIPGNSKFYAIEAYSTGNTTSTLSFTLTGDYTDDSRVEGYLISKMIILDVTYGATRPENPTSGVADDTVDVTTSDQPQTGSIYEITHAEDGSSKDYEIEVTNSLEPGEENKVYIVMEFYFSGVAGNEYQLLTLLLGRIVVRIEQNPDVEIV